MPVAIGVLQEMLCQRLCYDHGVIAVPWQVAILQCIGNFDELGVWCAQRASLEYPFSFSNWSNSQAPSCAHTRVLLPLWRWQPVTGSCNAVKRLIPPDYYGLILVTPS